MTTSFDASRYQRALERWRVLAERRLEHLTQLHDTGRWRRYFSEERFLSLIRETRTAVDLWQRLAPEQTPAAQVVVLTVEPSAARTPSLPSPFAATPGVQRSVA